MYPCRSQERSQRPCHTKMLLCSPSLQAVLCLESTLCFRWHILGIITSFCPCFGVLKLKIVLLQSVYPFIRMAVWMLKTETIALAVFFMLMSVIITFIIPLTFYLMSVIVVFHMQLHLFVIHIYVNYFFYFTLNFIYFVMSLVIVVVPMWYIKVGVWEAKASTFLSQLVVLIWSKAPSCRNWYLVISGTSSIF